MLQRVCVGGLQLLRQTMDTAAGAGLNMLRMWTNGVTPAYAVQRSPGVYNEGMLRGLDYVLDQARQRNLKVQPTIDTVLRCTLSG